MKNIVGNSAPPFTEEVYDQLQHDLQVARNSGRPITLFELKKIAVKHLKREVPREFLLALNTYERLDHLASFLILKDPPEQDVGYFLQIFTGARKTSKSTKKYFETCKLCYRLVWGVAFCSIHNRALNQKEYRRGHRIKKSYKRERASLREEQKRTVIPPLKGKKLINWLQTHMPILSEGILGNLSESVSLVEVLGMLDDSTEDSKDARKVEHELMVGLKQATYFLKEDYQIIGKVFLFWAEAWARAEKKRKWGGSRAGTGGARKNAGRKKLTAIER